MAIEASRREHDTAADSAWGILRAAVRLADGLERDGHGREFGFDAAADRLRAQAGDLRDPVVEWVPGAGWQSLLPPGDARSELLDLYLPICSATPARPMTVGHLGQSLDGFIATESGDSRFITGEENIVHLHRMRALCDAVIVGAGTVAADDPQLTTRHVPGPSPLRVVFDPARRLAATFRVFTDPAAPTLYCCAASRVRAGETHVGRAAIVGLDDTGPGGGVADLLRALHARGCCRVFVEGGGVTVSAFLEANLLDRLQITVAPVLIGHGRPAIRLAPRPRLLDCRRPGYRVFRMGGDVLFDCQPKASAELPGVPAPNVSRVI